MRGRLAYMNKHRNDPHKSAQGHVAFIQTLYYFNTWNILPFTEEADALFRQLRKRRIHIGSQDLRIAAIAVQFGFTVITSNVRDFDQVPHLKVKDWTAAPE